MMVESPPASALKMTQADFLFEFLVVTFNAPPKLCCVYHFSSEMAASRLENQYLVGSGSSSGYSISNHSSEGQSLRQ
jgi:hypothetical protein